MATAEAPSENMPPRSRAPMQLVAEKQVPDPQTLSSLIATATTTTATKPPVPRETEFIHRAAWKAGVMGALNLLAVVLAVRLVLLVAVAGAIYLAIIVTSAPDPWRLAALGVYTVTVVGPAAWLASRK